MSIVLLVCTFGVSLLGMLVLRPLARKLDLIDIPGGRKNHKTHTPLIGGIGIYLGLLTGSLIMPDLIEHYGLLLGLSTILLITGLIDDYHPLPVIAKISIQIGVAWLMCIWGNNQLITLGQLVGDRELYTENFSVFITIFATVGTINAINMIDGMDGLSGGMVILCLGLLALTTNFAGGNHALFNFSLLIIAGVGAFLLLNFRPFQKKPALVYLGDSGSMMLGFILAWLLIESSQGEENRIMPATVALWYLAIPLMDTVYLCIARPLSGKSPFEPGTDHFHHLLEKHGIDRSKIVLFMYIGGLILGGTGLTLYTMPTLEKYSLYFFLFLFFMYSVLIHKIKKPTKAFAKCSKEPV